MLGTPDNVEYFSGADEEDTPLDPSEIPTVVHPSVEQIVYRRPVIPDDEPEPGRRSRVRFRVRVFHVVGEDFRYMCKLKGQSYLHLVSLKESELNEHRGKVEGIYRR